MKHLMIVLILASVAHAGIIRGTAKGIKKATIVTSKAIVKTSKVTAKVVY
jgi:hypothetical protein